VTLREAHARDTAHRVSVIAGVDLDEKLVSSAGSPSKCKAAIVSQYGRFTGRILDFYPFDRSDSPDVELRTVAADSDTVCAALETDIDLRLPTTGLPSDPLCLIVRWIGTP
jgi:hypothetical protein